MKQNEFIFYEKQAATYYSGAPLSRMCSELIIIPNAM